MHHDDCLAGRNLGFSPGEVTSKNRGVGQMELPPVRNCKHFRWDQTILNIRFYLALADPVVNELDKYAGWRSPRDHPRQVIWSHRRRGSLRYLKRIRYSGRGAIRARAYGAWIQWRLWLKLHDRLLRPSTYLWKLRKIRADLRRSPA